MLQKEPINVRKLQRTKNATKQQFLHERWNLYVFDKKISRILWRFLNRWSREFLTGIPLSNKASKLKKNTAIKL